MRSFADLVVANAELEPEDFCADLDGFLGDGRHVLCFPKHVYDLDLLSCFFGLG